MNIFNIRKFNFREVSKYLLCIISRNEHLDYICSMCLYHFIICRKVISKYIII